MIPPAGGRRLYRYDLPAGSEAITSEAFLAINAFGVVTRTMRMYEHEDVLGRPITWGFDGPQLLIVPRAGVKANAFYERQSTEPAVLRVRGRRARHLPQPLARRCGPRDRATPCSTGSPRDLYNALLAAGSRDARGTGRHHGRAHRPELGELRATELLRTHGQLLQATAFSNVAEEFGQAKDPAHQAAALRSW